MSLYTRAERDKMSKYSSADELRCTGFDISVSAGDLLRVHADFIIPVSGRDNAELRARAMSNIALWMSGESINIVKSQGVPRCFYCGTKQKPDACTCSQCGAPL